MSTLEILRFLYSRYLSITKSPKCQKEQIHETNGNFRNVDTENTKPCRICLQKGSISIYGCNATEGLDTALYTVGGIDVSIYDSYPKYLCQSCHALLLAAMQFRKTARQTDKRLRKLKKIKNETKPESEISDHSVMINNNEELNKTNEQAPNILKELENPEADDIMNEINNQSLNVIKDNNRKVCKKLKEEINYPCEKCEIQFKSHDEYVKHKLSDEHKNKRILCTICNKTYSYNYIKSHIESHKPGKSYVCDICGKAFKRYVEFVNHGVIHKEGFPFPCSQCPYKSKRSADLRMHLRSHTGERPYQCEQCPQRFVSKSNLNKHAITHKVERDFKCHECSKGFRSKPDLSNHIQVVHTSRKKHICQYCDKVYLNRKHMMRHQRKIHKREKLRSGPMPIYLKIQQEGKLLET